MGILICIKGKKVVKIFRIGDTLQYLTMISAICKDASEQIAKEKGLTICKAMKFLFDCVEDVKGLLN